MKKILFLLCIVFNSSMHAQTWSENVAPILFNHCTKCHHPGGIGPSSFLTYEDAYNGQSSIYTAIMSGEMPPWPADPNYRHFVGENVLTTQEKQTIENWISAGAPSGDLALAPTTPVYNDNTQLPNIDATFTTPNYTSPATNSDYYRTFVIPSGLLQDGWLDAIEIIPGNDDIVHHVVISYDPTGAGAAQDAADPGDGFQSTGGGLVDGAKFIAAWAPGGGPLWVPNGFAQRLEAGGDFLIEFHYPAGSIGQSDQTTVNLHYSNDPTPREVWYNPILVHIPGVLDQNFLFIPANQTATFTETYNVPYNVTLIGCFPHMHLIGRSISSWAELPGGTTEPLISIPNWRFNWQLSYNYPQLLAIPQGTQLRAEAFYDNTSANPYNPNSPPQLVVAGEETGDEMMIVFYCYTYYVSGDENIVVEPIVSVSESNVVSETTVIYPNPNNGNFTLNTFFERFDRTSVSVYDMNGGLVHTEQVNIPGGMNSKSFNVNLPTGIYMMDLRGEHTNENLRFIVD
jgi:Secretion system C-terminal sorting domain